MNILIAGGSGFVGRALMPSLLKAGHTVTILGRTSNKLKSTFKLPFSTLTWDTLSSHKPSDYDAIINLTGANIADTRWNQQSKAILLSSRLDSISQLLTWCQQSKERKPHFYQASAVGFYPLQHSFFDNQTAYTEEDGLTLKADNSFSNALTRQCEAAAMKAELLSMPVTLMRFGVVLGPGEGILKKLTLPTKLGLGVIMGSGSQPLPWIEANDLANAILFLLHHPAITGAINLVAPEIVTNNTFMKTLAQVLHRPLFFKMPSAMVKILFGQMGDELLLAGPVVQPKRLLDHDFKFLYPTLKSALEHAYHGNEALNQGE